MALYAAWAKSVTKTIQKHELSVLNCGCFEPNSSISTTSNFKQLSWNCSFEGSFFVPFSGALEWKEDRILLWHRFSQRCLTDQSVHHVLKVTVTKYDVMGIKRKSFAIASSPSFLNKTTKKEAEARDSLRRIRALLPLMASHYFPSKFRSLCLLALSALLLSYLVVTVPRSKKVAMSKPVAEGEARSVTEVHGVKIEKNPPQSKLDELGVANWPKYAFFFSFSGCYVCEEISGHFLVLCYRLLLGLDRPLVLDFIFVLVFESLRRNLAR